MTSHVQNITLLNLSFAFIPVLLALYFLFKWSLNVKWASYSLLRMLGQLLLIGYVLSYIFYTDNVWLISAILILMVGISSWIALGVIKEKRNSYFKYAVLAIALGGGFTLVIMTQGVLSPSPWYQPSVLIPLAGMVFANAMNSVSLSVERLLSEIENNLTYQEARNKALNAATIPVLNSLLAVGLVSIPGMMTGQILSGVSPLIAARYQIMIMCMIFASAIISSVIFLFLVKSEFVDKVDES